jgi:PHD/YefM family antitoxin component YafN of YafNO toxin-antitoxin module
MNYTISSFRSNMWAILDKTKFQRKITTIWRRNKKEFVILPVEILENIDYKTILSTLEEDNYDNESIYAVKWYIENTKDDNIDWQKYIIN